MASCRGFKHLHESMGVVIDGLTRLADKRMIPKSQDSVAYVRATMQSGANLLVQLSRLGMDIEGIYETFIKQKVEYQGPEIKAPTGLKRIA